MRLPRTRAVTTMSRDRRVLRFLVDALALGAFVLLARAVLSISETDAGLAPLVSRNLAESGVPSHVTAVLLNFRGYDTLLEISVLVLATIGVLSLRPVRAVRSVRLTGPADPVTAFMARMLVPVMVVAAGYLLWAGEHAPGGAFQAGSIIGAAAVLLALTGHRRPAWLTDVRIRVAITVGFLVFLGVSLAPLTWGATLLEYPREHAAVLMAVIETWLTLSIGAVLASLYLSSAAPEGVEGEEER